MSFGLKLKNGDLKLTQEGTLETVTKNSKLRQDIVKMLLTKKGSIKYHKEYGSELGIISSDNHINNDLMESKIEQTVYEGISKLISLQKVQIQRQILSPSEMILNIKKVHVERDVGDPRLYNVFVSVITQQLSEISESITVRLI
jgi:phage baseplate assembly protein W